MIILHYEENSQRPVYPHPGFAPFTVEEQRAKPKLCRNIQALVELIALSEWKTAARAGARTMTLLVVARNLEALQEKPKTCWIIRGNHHIGIAHFLAAPQMRARTVLQNKGAHAKELDPIRGETSGSVDGASEARGPKPEPVCAGASA